jgi:hypothetical protein
MLYYRLYKRMKRNFHFHSAITLSLDYVTFVVLIPSGLGFLIGKIVYLWWPSEEVKYSMFFLSIGAAALYIHLCGRIDKEP